MKHVSSWLLIVTLLTGCAGFSGRLYPIQGPLSAQSPLPIYQLHASIMQSTITATLQNGEVCQGTWGPLTPDNPSSNAMSAQWDAVYGQGFFIAHILGKNGLSSGVATGNQGTTLNVEIFIAQPGQVSGVAADNKGNLYKLAF